MFNRSIPAEKIKFVCDQCSHKEIAECKLCPRLDGVMRPLLKGGWAHISCVHYNPHAEITKFAEGHDELRLCSSKDRSTCGSCFKNSFTLKKPGSKVFSNVKDGCSGAWTDLLATLRREYGLSHMCVRRMCAVHDCPDRKSKTLLVCGGQGRNCLRRVHVSCAQRPGSRWHLRLKEGQHNSLSGTEAAVEVLCHVCVTDSFLDVAAHPKPKYRVRCLARRPPGNRIHLRRRIDSCVCRRRAYQRLRRSQWQTNPPT
jgi:hypothetical protein